MMSIFAFILFLAYPQPSGYVNDFVDVIPPSYEQRIDGIIRELKDKTGVEIAVCLIKTTGGQDIQMYSVELYDRWKIGDREKDTGVLILAAINDRKAWITTGYGVEGILPDGLCGEIYRKDIVPYFRQGKYGDGILLAVSDIAGIVAKDYGVKLEGRTDIPRQIPVQKGPLGLILRLFPLIIFFLLFSRMGPLAFLFLPFGRVGYWGGGSSGGFSGGFGGFGGGGTGGGGAGGGW